MGKMIRVILQKLSKFKREKPYEYRGMVYGGLVCLIYSIFVVLWFYGADVNDIGSVIGRDIAFIVAMLPSSFLYRLLEKIFFFMPYYTDFLGIMFQGLILILEGMLVGFLIGKFVQKK